MARKIHIVGIANLTPDSFSDGGRLSTTADAVTAIEQMFLDGADYVDIGAESTRPGATSLSPNDEWTRLRDVLKLVMPRFPEKIMVDSYHPETIERIATQFGRFVINDVTGMNNPQMRSLAAKLQFPCVVSHLPASINTDIQKGHKKKPTTTIRTVVEDLSKNIAALVEDGLPAELIYPDPGFGFGKDPFLNNELLRLPLHMPGFKHFMLGVSRKSSLRRENFYGNLLADFAHMTDEATEQWLDKRSVAVARDGVKNGFDLLRVHNVKAHVEAFREVR